MIIMIDDHGYDGDDDDCDDPCVPVIRSPSLLTCWDCDDDHEVEDHDIVVPCVPVVCFCRSLFSLFQINMQVTIGQNPYSEDRKDQYSGKGKWKIPKLETIFYRFPKIFRYVLFAVINHIGTLDAGHYTSYIRFVSTLVLRIIFWGSHSGNMEVFGSIAMIIKFCLQALTR